MEELKIIQDKIRLENKKINEIDSRIDTIKRGKKLIKRPLQLTDDLINSINSITSLTKKSYNAKPKLVEKNINISKSLEIQKISKISSPNSNLILEKMKELKSMEIINLKNDKKINLLLKKEINYKDNIEK